jgi:hypothetical protein
MSRECHDANMMSSSLLGHRLATRCAAVLAGTQRVFDKSAELVVLLVLANASTTLGAVWTSRRARATELVDARYQRVRIYHRLKADTTIVAVRESITTKLLVHRGR